MRHLLVFALLFSACAGPSDRFIHEEPDDKLRESGSHVFFGRPGGRYQRRSIPHRTLSLEEVTFGHSGISARAQVAPERPAMLRRAHIAPAGSAPCTDGWPATRIRLDGQRRWDRPLALDGRHQLHLRFGAPAALLRNATVLDLSLEEPGGKAGCLRTSVAPDDETGPWLRQDHDSPGGGLALTWAPQTLGGEMPERVRNVGLIFSGSEGLWLGRWRLGGRVDFCIVSCSATRFLTVPVSFTADRLLWVGSRMTFGAGLGYQAGRLDDLYSLISGPRTYVHGPRASLLLLSPRPLLGAQPDQGFSARGLELFVTRRFYSVFPADVQQGAAWVFGIGAIAL